MLPDLKIESMKSIPMILVMMLFCTAAFCLNEGSPKSTTPAGSLPQQYKNLKADLDIIDGYRMIKMYTMDRFWTVVEDSLRTQKSKYKESIATIANQKAEIAGLKSSLKKTENDKLGLETRVDGMIVFGKVFPKAAVISVSVVIIIGLVLLAGILSSISRVSFYTTRELRKLNENIYLEFDTYKRNAVEKEIKLSRELQNYRNKFAEAKMA